MVNLAAVFRRLPHRRVKLSFLLVAPAFLSLLLLTLGMHAFLNVPLEDLHVVAMPAAIMTAAGCLWSLIGLPVLAGMAFLEFRKKQKEEAACTLVLLVLDAALYFVSAYGMNGLG